MSAGQEYDSEVIPNQPTSLVSSAQFDLRAWFYSMFDSVLIGFLGGWAAVGFTYLIQFCTWLFFTVLGNVLALHVGGVNLIYILLPAIGGIIIGPIMMKYAPEVRGEGIPEVMETVVLRDVTIRKRVGVLKAIASAITIGSGGSAGREGPIAQIGASVGSTVAQVFKLDRSRARHMVICGFAAGIAGIFNAPLGGAFFALEVLGGTIVVLDAVPVFVSAAISAVIHTLVFGHDPVFAGASMGSITVPQYAFVVFLGLILGVIGILWHGFFSKTRRVMDRVKIDPKYKPIVGGLITGCIGIFFVGEGVFGLGHEGIEAAFLLQYSIGLLFLLAFAKMTATAFTLTSGGSGGLLQPTLFIGTMLGGAFGLLFAALSPDVVTDPSLFSIIGMGAMFAGVSQCPINTFFMIPELTRNYNLIFPQLVASMASYVVFRLVKRGSSIYTTKLEQRGVPLKMGGKIDLTKVAVADIMNTEIPVVESQMLLSTLEDFYAQHKYPVYPVIDGEKFVGTVAITCVLELPHEFHEIMRVADVLDPGTLSLPMKANAQMALTMLLQSGAPLLLIFDEADPRKLAGVVTQAEIHQIYESFAAGEFREVESANI